MASLWYLQPSNGVWNQESGHGFIAICKHMEIAWGLVERWKMDSEITVPAGLGSSDDCSWLLLWTYVALSPLPSLNF